jgi:catechol 2,3-dioxygenase-like lactoylglutathione lyase family enzyme
VSTFREEATEEVDFFAWLQWVADEQLGAAQARATRGGMGLGVVHDLAVGVHPRGADAWALRTALAQGVTVGAPGQDVDIVLSYPHGGRSKADGDALLELMTKGSIQAAIFRADDLDATFEQVRASGAEVLQEPKSQPWGARDCAFRDPSGNLVRIAQR